MATIKTKDFVNHHSVSTTPAPVPAITNEHWPFFVTLVSISALCLFVTIILYISIREKHNCKGWTQFSYLMALFLFDIVFIPALSPGLTMGGEERNIVCVTLSVLNQFFFVCSKTWLLIFSIDIYFAIRKPRAVAQVPTKNLSKFLIYSIIGWGFPSIFVISGVILTWKNRKKHQQVSQEGLWTTFPDYGFQHCRIPSWSVWEYFVFGNCLFHFLMFGLIGITIFCQRQNFDSAETSTTRRKQSSLVLLLRLFIVVGLSWSYIALQDLLGAGNINTQQNWVWHIFRCVFFLQGAFISVIIITNGRTLQNVLLKYPRLKESLIRLKTVFLMRTLHCIVKNSDNRKESVRSYESQKTINSVISDEYV